MLLLPMVRFSTVALFWVLLRFSVEANKISPGVLESVAKDQAEANISGNAPNGVLVVVKLLSPQMDTAGVDDLSLMLTEIKTMRDEVIAALKDHYESLYEFEFVPGMAGLINSMDAVEILEKHENVETVDLDIGGTGSGLQAERNLLKYSVPFVKAEKRHQQGNKGDGVVVAVLDSGIDTNNANFAGRIVYQACFADDDTNPYNGGRCPNGNAVQFGPGAAEDDAGHGTHVTGIIASNGFYGDVGMAPKVSIASIKVTYGPSFMGEFSSALHILQGLEDIIRRIVFHGLNVKIINISLGFGRYAGNCDLAHPITVFMWIFVGFLKDRFGVITFAPSGNSYSDTFMTAPACISNVIAVAASDLFDQPWSGSNSNSETDLFAPGVDIDSSAIGGGTVSKSGTSYAAPHTAGCAALLVESGEGTSPQDIENRLKLPLFTVTWNGLEFARMDCSPLPPTLVTGDPHFRTWHGKAFSYQGECDLVLISSPMFSSGLGLDLHIRTKRRHWWSFVQHAALRIGPDVLEVTSDKNHFLNGVLDAELPSKIGGYEVSKIVVDSPFSIVYFVNLGEGQTIKISRGKRRMLSVDVSQHQKTFHDSVGLMGTWKKKGLIARDGVTDLLNDPNAFGREWQVLDSENQLFHTLRYPQHPEICIEGSNENRRLEEMPERIPMALVEKACSHVEDANKDFCIYDVMAMGDLSVAESPFYTKDINQY